MFWVCSLSVSGANSCVCLCLEGGIVYMLWDCLTSCHCLTGHTGSSGVNAFSECQHLTC